MKTSLWIEPRMEPSCLTLENARIARAKASGAKDPDVSVAWLRLAETYEHGARLLDLVARGEARLWAAGSDSPAGSRDWSRAGVR
jgi:hypothetical protein